MNKDFNAQADWLVRQWLFRGPALFYETLDQSYEEIIQSAWDEFSGLLDEKGLGELRVMEEHLKGVVRAILFHSSQTQYAILTHKADTPEGLDPSNLPDEEEFALHELDEWIRHEETQARVANIQREEEWQRQMRGQPGQNHEEGNGGNAKEEPDEGPDHMKRALDHRAQLRDLYRLTSLRFSVLQGVMFYSTAFGIRTKWDGLTEEAKRAVIEQATDETRGAGGYRTGFSSAEAWQNFCIAWHLIVVEEEEFIGESGRETLGTLWERIAEERGLRDTAAVRESAQRNEWFFPNDTVEEVREKVREHAEAIPESELKNTLQMD